MTTPNLDRLARAAYDAHRDAGAGSDPPWEDLTEGERKTWRAVVTAVTNPGEATLTDGPPAQSLVVQAGGQTHVFHAEFTAGRQGTLVLSDEHASSHHALFQFAHSYWYVKDLDSTNGTWLNGRRIYNAQRLKKGDKVKVGRTVIAVLSV